MKILLTAAACALATLSLGGCSLTESGQGDRTSSSDRVTVTSSDDACTLSSTSAGAGTLTFEVENTGSAVTEFYLYAEDGKRIVGEVENIGPGLTRELVLTATPGTYVTACKPGMRGTGVRGTLRVTGNGNATPATADDRAAEDRATAAYAAYVREQADALLERTTAFVAAYRAGDDARARSLYATARQPWERIEPVAESFGDLDPRMDLREADLEPGQRWTGWHRIEKDLWPPATGYRPLGNAARARCAADLLASTKVLHARVQALDYRITQLGNGAKELMDEVATGKVTGEEEVWSHTDLDDFQANVDGARKAFALLRPILVAKDPALEQEIAQRFTAVQSVLDRHRSGKAFVSYDTVTEAQRKQLSDAVNALAEPLSRMTGAVVR